MESKLVQESVLPLIPSKHGRECFKKVLLTDQDTSSDLCMFNIAFLEAGKHFEKHSHSSMDEIFYVISGMGLFTVGNKEYSAQTGSCIYVPAKANHFLTAQENMKFIVIGIALS